MAVWSYMGWALLLAALLNAVAAYDDRARRRKAALLWFTSGLLALMALYAFWPFF